MKPPWIVVRREPYEEPYSNHFFIWVSNGLYMGGTDFYRSADDLIAIGKALLVFPRSVPDEYHYEYGGDRLNGQRWYRYLLLRAFTKNRAGACAIQVIIDLKQDVPNNGYCEFSLHVEAAQLNRLGRLFCQLHELEHGEIHWNNDSALIFEDYREMGEDTLADFPKGFID